MSLKISCLLILSLFCVQMNGAISNQQYVGKKIRASVSTGLTTGFISRTPCTQKERLQIALGENEKELARLKKLKQTIPHQQAKEIDLFIEELQNATSLFKQKVESLAAKHAAQKSCFKKGDGARPNAEKQVRLAS